MVVVLLFLILIVLIIFTLFFIKDKFPIFFINAVASINKNILFLKKEFINSFKSVTTKTGIVATLFLIIYSYCKYRFFDYEKLIKINESMTGTKRIYYNFTLSRETIENLYLKEFRLDLKYILLSLIILILLEIIIKKIRTIPLLPIFLIFTLGSRLYLGNRFELNYDKNIHIIEFLYFSIPLGIGSLISIKYLKRNKLNIIFIIFSILFLIFVILCQYRIITFD